MYCTHQSSAADPDILRGSRSHASVGNGSGSMPTSLPYKLTSSVLPDRNVTSVGRDVQGTISALISWASLWEGYFRSRVAETENLKTVPAPIFDLNTVPAPVPGHIHTYTFTNTYTYMCTISQTYTYTHTETYTYTLRIHIQYTYVQIPILRTVHACTSTYTYTYTYTYMYMYSYSYTYTFTQTHTSTVHIHKCTYIPTFSIPILIHAYTVHIHIRIRKCTYS